MISSWSLGVQFDACKFTFLIRFTLFVYATQNMNINLGILPAHVVAERTLLASILFFFASHQIANHCVCQFFFGFYYFFFIIFYLYYITDNGVTQYTTLQRWHIIRTT